MELVRGPKPFSCLASSQGCKVWETISLSKKKISHFVRPNLNLANSSWTWYSLLEDWCKIEIFVCNGWCLAVFKCLSDILWLWFISSTCGLKPFRLQIKLCFRGGHEAAERVSYSSLLWPPYISLSLSSLLFYNHCCCKHCCFCKPFLLLLYNHCCCCCCYHQSFNFNSTGGRDRSTLPVQLYLPQGRVQSKYDIILQPFESPPSCWAFIMHYA